MTSKFSLSALRTALIYQTRCTSYVCNNTRILPNLILPRTSLPIRHQISVWRQFHTTTSLKSHDYDNDKRTRSLPVLMKNHTEIIWPSVFKSLGNMIAATFIVTPYFDNDFSLPEFVRGAKQALLIIANSLAKGDADSLEGLVNKKALTEIKQNVSHFSMAQLSELSIINPDEIYLSFPYKLGIIMNDTDKGVQERFVEITVCYHVFRGLPELIKSGEFRPGPAAMRKHQDRITICNYRFIREFTKGVQDQWTVNMVHHFKLADAD